MVGEQPGEESGDPRGFLAKPLAAPGDRLRRALHEIVLAVGLLTGLFMVKYQKVAEPAHRGVIGYVLPGSPADKAGVREGDRIVRIVKVRRTPPGRTFSSRKSPALRERSRWWWSAAEKTIPVDVVPTLDERTGVGMAGWAQRAEIQIATLSPGLPAEKAGLKKATW